jgi:predicted DNA-binding ribbon-helix-helix protein
VSEGEIREASSHNPKKFWDILKRCTNAKKSNIGVPLTELYEYFKNINSSDEEYEQNNVINKSDISLICIICLSFFMKSLSTGSTFAVKPWCLFSPYI